jgi:hypothetical protein
MILVATVGRGDVLVTADGHRIQTTGAWTVKGSMVQFKDTRGRLTSLRLDEVDMAASREATKRVEREAEEEPAGGSDAKAAATEPVRVFADHEFTTVHPRQKKERLEEPASKGSGNPLRLKVRSWQQVEPDNPSATVISGNLENVSDDVLAEVALAVNLFAEGGEVLASQAASLESRVLRPGETTGFRVSLDGLFVYHRVEFRESSVPLLLDSGAGEDED